MIVAQYGVNEYHFLDWNGRMKKRIVTDRKVVNPAFDFDTNTFYGLDWKRMNPNSIRPKSYDCLFFAIFVIVIV